MEPSPSGGGDVSVLYDNKSEEFSADFILIAKRTLDQAEYKLFSYHYLLGADFKLCCWRLKMDRGSFFHAIYRIQQKLGRAFRETTPHPLFPVYEYFEEVRRPAVDSLERTKAGLRGERNSAQRVPPRRADQPYPGAQPSEHRRRIA